MHGVATTARFRDGVVAQATAGMAAPPETAPTLDMAISDLHHAANRLERAVEQAEAIGNRYFGPAQITGATGRSTGEPSSESAATHDRLRCVIARIGHAIDHLDDEVARLGRI